MEREGREIRRDIEFSKIEGERKRKIEKESDRDRIEEGI